MEIINKTTIKCPKCEKENLVEEVCDGFAEEMTCAICGEIFEVEFMVIVDYQIITIKK